MADASRTPTPATRPAAVNSLPSQFLKVARQLNDAQQREGAPAGGVTFTYGPTAITGTFNIPIERIPQEDGGELLQPIDFVQ